MFVKDVVIFKKMLLCDPLCCWFCRDCQWHWILYVCLGVPHLYWVVFEVEMYVMGIPSGCVVRVCCGC